MRSITKAGHQSLGIVHKRACGFVSAGDTCPVQVCLLRGSLFSRDRNRSTMYASRGMTSSLHLLQDSTLKKKEPQIGMHPMRGNWWSGAERSVCCLISVTCGHQFAPTTRVSAVASWSCSSGAFGNRVYVVQLNLGANAVAHRSECSTTANRGGFDLTRHLASERLPRPA